MRLRGLLAAFVAALSVVLMVGLAQNGTDLLRADRAAARDMKRATADTEQADAGAMGQAAIRAVSFNMCGGSCNGGKTNLLPHIATKIDAWRPHLVMLQEVCHSQFEWFKARTFTAGTYEFGYTPMMKNYAKCAPPGTNCAVNEDADPANDDQRCYIGQVLGGRGHMWNRQEIDLGGEHLQIAETDTELRYMPPRDFTALCYDVILDGIDRQVKGCSTHLRAFHDPTLINQRARTLQAARLATALDEEIFEGKVVVVGGDFNSWSYPSQTPAMSTFYHPDVKPSGSSGVFYEADQNDKRFWTNREPYCVQGVDLYCRSGESTLVNEGPTTSHNTKYDYIFYSESEAPELISGDAIPMYLTDAAGTGLTDDETKAARYTEGGKEKYYKISDHAFYQSTATVWTYS